MDIEFIRESPYGTDGFCHQTLCAGDFILDPLRAAAPRLLSQRQQPEIDPHQGLDDFILKLATDFLSFIFLRRKHPVGFFSNTIL